MSLFKKNAEGKHIASMTGKPARKEMSASRGDVTGEKPDEKCRKKTSKAWRIILVIVGQIHLYGIHYAVQFLILDSEQ